MSDPVAEAAANLAAQQAEPSLLEKAMDTIHDLEAKVEHLIHPDAEAGSATPGEPQSPAAGAAANSEVVQTTSGASSVALATSTLATDSVSDVTGVTTEASTPTLSASQDSTSAAAIPESASSVSGAEVGNVVAAVDDGGPVAGAVVADGGEAGNVVGGASSVMDGAATAMNSDAESLTQTNPASASLHGGDLPNAVSAVAESTTVTASAESASGSGETSSTGENSGEGPNAGGTTATATVDSAVTGTPTSSSASQQDQSSQTLGAVSPSSAAKPAHVRIAQHLEAIYTIATEAPATAATDTSVLKTHVGDILHRISNGMAVTEGELVQKLEALYRML